MKPIEVIVKDGLYKWVDTVVLDNDGTQAVAVLVHAKTGKVTTVRIRELLVIDSNIIRKRSYEVW